MPQNYHFSLKNQLKIQKYLIYNYIYKQEQQIITREAETSNCFAVFAW